MKSKIFPIICLVGLLVLFVLFIIFNTIRQDKEADLNDHRRLATIGNIQFKGTVISSNTYDRGGRNYFLICVRLDYTNTKAIDIANDLCLIRIKDNIATMAAGFLDPYFGVPRYVEVNINNSGVQKYIYAQGREQSFSLGLARCAAPITQLTFCK